MATIKDVAKASGVSATTVSFVLNNSGAVGIPTRERVLQAARHLNYHPSAVARGLLNKPMNTVGVIFTIADPSPITNPYFAPILDGITAAAARLHQNAMLFTGHIWSDADHSLPIFCDGRCDGLILVGPDMGSDIVPSLLARHVPFVLINNRCEDEAASYVDVDDFASAHAITSYLLEQGHQRVAFLCSNLDGGFSARRLAGYRQALKERGFVLKEKWVLSGDFSETSIAERLSALLDLPTVHRPTALLCVNDFMALDALEILEQWRVRVPEDISVAGFDDVAPSAVSRPPLTTMRQPFRRLGERAVVILLARLAEDEQAGHKDILTAELIKRGSVSPVAQKR